jgi:ligand-binding sensor domain-containing protein
MGKFFTKRYLISIACVFALIAVNVCSIAQPTTLLQKNIIFDQITQEIGLTQASINCILQDHEGYLWIGTWS